MAETVEWEALGTALTTRRTFAIFQGCIAVFAAVMFVIVHRNFFILGMVEKLGHHWLHFVTFAVVGEVSYLITIAITRLKMRS